LGEEAAQVTEEGSMAVLSAADRKHMPAKDFGGPGRSFPMNDKNHDRMAISGATRSEHAGNISEAEADKIKSEARAKLGDKGGDDPQREHRVAVAKMHPKHVHDLVKHAMTGKAGPEAKQMASQATQQDPDSQAPPQSGGKDYSGMFAGGGSPAPAAPPSGSPFGGN
jgi:hypothetical protein